MKERDLIFISAYLKLLEMKLLIIDDTNDITDLFAKVLGTLGHEIVTSDNGIEGLDLMMKQKFDAILLDIAMPDFTGLDVIDKLIETDKIRDSLIVLLTASSITDAEVKELVKKGVHSCLRKPVKIEILLEKMDELNVAIQARV
ncbi:MAG: response regulator [Nitrososphaeraceae archaeon]|jgi:two-component system, OmpR family, response regulator